MVQSNQDQQKICLPRDYNYFEGNMYDDDLIFNYNDYEKNEVLDSMEICNITLMKGDMVKTNS